MATEAAIAVIEPVSQDMFVEVSYADQAEMGTAQIGYAGWHPRNTNFGARVNSVLLNDKWVQLTAAAPDFGSMLTVSGVPGQEPSRSVLMLEEKSTGFSEAIRSQLARLSRDPGAVTDAFGSRSAQWVAGEIEPLLTSLADLSDLTAMQEVLQRVFQARAEAAVEEAEQRSRREDYPEWEWIQRNRTLLQERYAGLWIAVVGRQLVAVADAPADLLEQTEGFERPFMYHVAAESEPALVASG